MDSVVKKCPLCVVNAGRFTKSARCCQVRKLADAPKHARAGVFEGIYRDEGKEAANQLMSEVNTELAHRRERRATRANEAMAAIRKITGAGSGDHRRRVAGHHCASKGRDSNREKTSGD